MSSYQQSSTVLAESFEDSMVLYDTETERYFSLNSLGAEVWRALTEPSTLGSLVEQVVSEYEVEFEAAESDVRELLQHLEQASLIQRTDS